MGSTRDCILDLYEGQVQDINLDENGNVYFAQGNKGIMVEQVNGGEDWGHALGGKGWLIPEGFPVARVMVDDDGYKDGYVYIATQDFVNFSQTPVIRKIDIIDEDAGEYEQVWIQQTGANEFQPRQYSAHTAPILAFTVAGGYIYSASDDNTVRKTDPLSGKVVHGGEIKGHQWEQIRICSGHSDGVNAIAVDGEGYIYSASDDKTVHKISPDGSHIRAFDGHNGPVNGVAVDEDGYVYSASDDAMVRKIDPDWIASYSDDLDFLGVSHNSGDMGLDMA